ncbi:MAG: hypothetical protein PHR00_01985 [Patescibacteria group bacterium]|nr:hypothetical protein [Patescibacteria group bacterium]
MFSIIVLLSIILTLVNDLVDVNFASISLGNKISFVVFNILAGGFIYRLLIWCSKEMAKKGIKKVKRFFIFLSFSLCLVFVVAIFEIARFFVDLFFGIPPVFSVDIDIFTNICFRIFYLMFGIILFSQKLVRKIGAERLLTKYTVKVDYNLSIEEAVKAGKYDCVATMKDDEVSSSNFPALPGEEGQKNLKFVLVHFGLVMNSDNVIVEMDKLGYRPATMREGLAFGVEHSDLQRQFPIVALGQWADLGGIRHVLFLIGNNSGRILVLFRLDSNWFEFCRFLFVRK